MSFGEDATRVYFYLPARKASIVRSELFPGMCEEHNFNRALSEKITDDRRYKSRFA